MKSHSALVIDYSQKHHLLCQLENVGKPLDLFLEFPKILKPRPISYVQLSIKLAKGLTLAEPY